MPEHEDYHFACELRKQQNKLDLKMMHDAKKVEQNSSSSNGLEKYFSRNAPSDDTVGSSRKSRQLTPPKETSLKRGPMHQNRGSKVISSPKRKKKQEAPAKTNSPSARATSIEKFLQKRIS